VGKVTTLSSLFARASKFAGAGLDSWDISKVTDFGPPKLRIFKDATSLTSCSKRRIVDAWKSSAVFTDTTYDTDWAGETCPMVREDVVCEERCGAMCRSVCVRCRRGEGEDNFVGTDARWCV
jgi:hypothetical protein